MKTYIYKTPSVLSLFERLRSIKIPTAHLPFSFSTTLLLLFLFLSAGQQVMGQSFSAILSSNQKFNRPTPGAVNCGGTYGTFTSVSSGSTSFSYATQSLTISTPGNYTMTVTSSTASDPMLFVYSSFNPSSPTSSFIVGDDDSNGNLLSKIGGCNNYFNAGTYTIVVTSYSSSTTSGTVNFSVSGAGTVVVLPSVTTSSASNIGSNTVTLGGNCTATGGASVSSTGVAYSTSQNPTSGSSMSSGTGTFSGSISGLSSGTTYYYRAYATNSVGTAYGAQYSFTTSSVSSPSVTTSSVSSITTNSATSGYSVTSNGGATVTSQGIVWNTTGTPTIVSNTGTSSGSLTSLSPNTTYYVRAFATNSAGTGYGTQYSFITVPIDPTSPVASPATICNGSSTQLSVSNAQGSVYWYTGSCGGTYVGTGNPLTVYPTTTTTYYARNNNASGFSAGCVSTSVTVNQPASQPASASVTVPAGVDGLTKAATSWGVSTGLAPISYFSAVGPASTVTYESGYAARINSSNLTEVLSGLTKSTTYYLAVKGANSCGASVYRTSASFRTNSTIDYTANANGTISGTTSQIVTNNTSGTAVTAVPNTGYNLVSWSDGQTAYTRTENNVTNSMALSATFAANRLQIGTQPSNKIAGANIPVTVRITDTYGNTMTNSNAAVTIAISTNPSIGGAGVLNGTLTVNAVNGIATFTDLWINKTGNGYTLIATAANPIITQPISTTFNITPAAIDHFTVANITDPVVAGTPTSPVVTAYDQYDNIKTNYLEAISFSSDDNYPAVLPAAYTFVAGDNGIHTFTNGVILKRTGERTVTVTGDTKTGSQTAITVTPSSINEFQLVANGGLPITAGVPFSVTATVYDQFGNIKTNYEGLNNVLWNTTASTSFNGTPRIIPANGDQTFTAGTATIGGFTFFNSHETPTITITDGPYAKAGTTAPIVVKNNILNNFKVIAGTEQIAGTPFSTTVTARDIYWNTCIDYVGSIRFKSSDDALVSFPAGLQSFVGYSGVRTFSDAITINKIDAYWLRAADSNFAFKSGEQQNIIVSPGAFSPTKSSATIDSDNKIAGESVVVTLTPRDAQNNLLLSCQNITTYLDGVLKGTEDLNGTTLGSDGIYQFKVPVTSTTANNLITAKLGTEPFSQSFDITVTPAPASLANTTIIPDGASITTDQNQVVTVQLKDQYNNNRTTNDGTVTLTTSLGGFGDNAGTKTVTAAYAGNGDYTATLYASTDGTNGTGLATITGIVDFNSAEGPGVWSGATWPTDGAIVDNGTVTITEGLPNLSTSVITSLPATISTDGTSNVAIQLKDALGNLIVNNRGTVSLTSDLGLLSSVAYDANGIYKATLTGDTRGTNGTGTATIIGNFTGTGTATSVTGAFADNTTTVDIEEGLPSVSNIEITTNDATITADGNTLVTVQLKDQFGNLIVNNRGTVTLSTNLGVNDNTTTSGATDITANYTSGGKYTATFKMDGIGVGNATITGKYNAVTISDNAIVAVTHGAATQLNIQTQPAQVSQAIAGETFNTQAQIRIKDQWGNLVTTGANSTASVTATQIIGSTVLQGTTTVNAIGGIAQYTNLSYNIAENINIEFTASGLSSITSNNINVVHNVPNYMVITGSTDQTAGVAQTITIKAFDAYGNTADRFTGSKALTFLGANTSPTPPYYPTVSGTNFGTPTAINFIGGEATASMILYKEELALVTANYTNANYTDIYTGTTAVNINAVSANRLDVNVHQSVPTYLAITGSGTQVAGNTQTITVKAYDDFNNLATNYTGTKTIRFGGANSSLAPVTNATVDGVNFGSDVTISFVDGIATSSMALYKVENAVITATDQAVGGIATKIGYTLPVVVSHAAANYYAVTGTGVQTAGASQIITVSTYDAYNNLATDYTGSKSVTFSGANGSPAPSTNPTVASTEFGTATTLAFTNGVAIGSMSLYKMETANIVATSGSITTPQITGYDYRLAVAVNHATPNYMAVTGNATQTAGTSQTITVKAYDIYNNLAVGYTGSHSLTFSGANVSPAPSTSPTVTGTTFGTSSSFTFTNGVTTGSMSLYKVETAQITTSDGTINADDHKLAVVVNHATPNYMTVTGSGTQVAGVSQNVTITAFDTYNNLATDYAGTKSLTFSGANLSPQNLPYTAYKPIVNAIDFGSATSLDFTSGSVTTSMNLYKVETAVLTATDGTINANSHNLPVVVSQSAPAYLATTGTATQIAGTSQTITVKAYDGFNNLATNYTGSKSLTFTGASPSSAAAANNNMPTPTTPAVNPTVGGTAFSTSKVLTFTNGVTTGSMMLYKTETAQVTATDGTITSDAHKLTVSVTPTLLYGFIVTNVGNPHDLGVAQSPTVEAIDTYNNRKTNYVGKVTFSNTEITASTPADYTFTLGDAGIHTFTNAVLFKIPGKWWLTALDLNEPQKYGAQSDIIVQRAVTITANNRSKTYGDVLNLGTTDFSISGIVSGINPVAGEITGVTLTSAGSAATASVAGSTYPIAPSLATGTYDPAYYRIVYNSTGSLTVNAAPLNVSALTGQTKIYGQSNPSYTYDATGFKNGETVSIMTGNLGRDAGEYVGNYAITLNTLSAGSNYSINFTSQDFAITKKPITISVDPGQTKVYGKVDPTFTFTSTGLAFSDVFGGSLTREVGENVATSPYLVLRGSLKALDGSTDVSDNYDLTFNSNPFTITPKDVTVQANANQHKTYGSINPTYNFTSSPAVGSILPNGDAITFDGNLTRDAGETVGNYTINQGSLANTNYTIAYTNNDFAIDLLDVTVNADDSQSKVYGQVDPTFTYTTIPAIGSSLANGSTIELTGNLNRATGENVGNYAIGLGNVTNSNYNIAYNTKDFAINTLPVTLTANASQQKVYGDVDPVLTYTSSPVVGATLANNEVIAFTGNLSRAIGETVGSYAINKGTVDNANYAITYTGDNFAINQLPVTVTANIGQNKVYGTLDPVFTYTSSPAVGATLANGLNVSFTGNLDRTTGENVANYAIGLGSVANSNYAIAYTTNDFAITPLTVSVTTNVGQNKIYGQLDPTFTYVASPSVGTTLANGEVIGFTGSLGRNAGQTVGTYPTTIGTLANANYNVDFTSALFTINKLDITGNYSVTPSKVYDGGTLANVLTRTLNGVINADDVSLTGGIANYGDKNIGVAKTVTLTGYGLSGTASGNYNLTSVATTTADITKRTLNLSNFGADSKFYDGTKTATGIGFNDDRLAGDNLAFGRTAEFADANVGTNKDVNYSSISISGGLDKDNYVLATTTGIAKADIWAKPITATINASDKAYNGDNVATVALTGNFAIVDDVAITATSATFNDKNVGSNKTVTVYGMALTGTDAAKYALVSTSGITTANITAKELTVTGATAANKVYDGTAGATISGATLIGVVSPDDVTLANSTVGTFTQASVGANIVVNSAMSLTGTDVDNYTLTQPALSATISTKTLTLSDPSLTTSKVYDGSKNADVSAGSLTGIENSDALNLTATASYNTASVATGKTITVVYNLSGSAASNYTPLANYSVNTGAITAKTLTITDPTVTSTKVYNGTTVANMTIGSLSGVETGDVVNVTATANYNSATAASGKTITVIYTLSGSGASNYNALTNFTVNNAVITAKPLTIAIPTLTTNKVYNGSTSADVVIGSLVGIETGDVVTATATANYNTSSVATGKTITVVYSLGGSEASNYSAPIDYSVNTAVITAKTLTIADPTLTDTKIYDGSTVATVIAGSLSGKEVGDDVNVTATANYNTASVATGKTITVVYSLSGSGAGNYNTLANYSVNTGAITAKTLSIANPTLTLSKVYDGTTSANVLVGSLSGVETGDVVNVSATANYNTALTGNGKAITVVYSLSGSSASNYNALADYSVATGIIAPKQLTISTPTVTATKVYDGNSIANVAIGALTGVEPMDVANVTVNGAANYDNANVGSGKTITVAYGLSGSAIANYIAPVDYALNSGVINGKTLAISLPTLTSSKIYDGTNEAAIANVGTLSGIEPADAGNVSVTATATYNNASAGLGKTITMVYTLTGSAAYKYATPADYTINTGTIDTKALSITDPLLTTSKTYDANANAVVTAGSLTGVIAADVANVNLSTIATYDNSNVGNGKTITVTYGLSGSAASNYSPLSNYSVITGEILQKTLSLGNPTLTANKTYDGTTTAVVSAGSLSGIEPSDVGNVILSSVATYNNSTVGNAKTITVVYTLSGSAANKYVTPANYVMNTATITAKPLSLGTPVLTTSKTYDGATTAVVIPGTLIGVETADASNFNLTATANYNNSLVGSGKTITVNYSLSGSAAVNYQVPADYTTNSAVITAKELTVTGATTVNKVYDGTTAATIGGAALVGVVSGDVVTLATSTGVFAQKTVGTNIAVTAALTLGGTNATNYTLMQPTGLKAYITAKDLTVTGAAAAIKMYDGTTSATLSGASLIGIVNGDNVTLATLTGAFVQKNVGTNISITTAFTLGGTDVTNYNLIQPTDLTSNITAKPLAISTPVVFMDKMYDTNTSAVITSVGSLIGVMPSDVSKVTVTATASYSSATIGGNKTITVIYTLNGAEAGNYLVPANYIINTAKISGEITLSPLSTPTPACQGSDLRLDYTVLTGTVNQYKFTFDAAANAAGIKNVAYTGNGLPLIGDLPISIPTGTPYGKYTGTLQMRNELGIESQLYTFQFTVNISSDLISTKFDDVVLVSNHDNKFASYQWFKNGVEIDKATKQFYCDSEGLNGEYSVRIRTVDGYEFNTCPKTLNIPQRTSISVYPNPVKVGQICTIKASGFTNEELENAVMSIYNAQGKCVYVKSSVAQFNTIPLPDVSGVYIGRIATTGGKEYNFKVIVLIK